MATVMAVVVGVSVLRGDALWWAPVAAIALGYGLAVTVWLLGVWQVGYASVKGAAALLIGLVIAAVLGLGIAGLTA